MCARSFLPIGSFVLLVACSSEPRQAPRTDTPAAAPATPVQAAPSASVPKGEGCKLLTRDEVQAALGDPVGEPVASQHILGGASCSYMTMTTTSLPRTVIVVVWPASHTMKQLQDSLRNFVEGGRFQQEPGIGDEAFWAAGTLYVRKGKVIFSLSPANLKDPSPAGHLAVAKGLAKKAVGRVP